MPKKKVTKSCQTQGKALPVQPTIMHYFSKTKRSAECDTIHSEEISNEHRGIQLLGSTYSHEAIEGRCKSKTVEGRCNPFKSKTVECQNHPCSRDISIPGVISVGKNRVSIPSVSSQRKSLSLSKNRKRKHRILNFSPQKAKRTESKGEEDIDSISEFASSRDIDAHRIRREISEDEEMMKGYTESPRESPRRIHLSDISKNNSESEHNYAESSYFDPKLPVSPTFSPRKHSLSSFSPFLLKDSHQCSQGIESPNEDLTNSIPLFSTPLQSDSRFTSPNTRPNEKVTKRALFLHDSDSLYEKETCADDGKTTNGSVHEFSFGGDISLSQFLYNSMDVSNNKGTSLNRYLVLEVVTQTSTEIGCNGRHKPELLLRLLDEKEKMEKLCYLRDDWFGTDVIPGDTVQINAVLKESYVVDNADPDSSIIVHPDSLISGTSVSNAITCTRKAVLAEKFKGVSSGNEAMIIGQFLHKIYQATLSRLQGVSGSLALRDLIKEEMEIVITSLESLDHLYSLNMSEILAIELLSEQIPAIEEWCQKFLHSEPQLGIGDIEFKKLGDDETQSCVCVTDIVDIEESVWSPRFGLKGRIDVTVNIKEKRGARKQSEVVITERVPLELKTGKVFRKQGTIEHRAQVILYSLMLSDRYSTSPPGGLLVYLKANHMQGLPSLPHEKRGLLMARNNLARYYGNHIGSLILPGMLKDLHTCKHCPYLKQCCVYHRAIEKGCESSSGLGEHFSTQIHNVTPSHLKFFSQWFSLLAEEEQYCRSKDRAFPWLSMAHDREKEGLGCADMIAHPPTYSKQTERYSQTFTRGASSVSDQNSIISLSANDRIIISCQDGSAWAIAMGSIESVMPGPEVRVTLDKSVQYTGEMMYRIDKVPGYSGGILYGNLAELCASDTERQHHLRELIIDCLPPQFESNVEMYEEKSLPLGLNSNQKAAIQKVLTAKDYALILGMPGTGKTTTITGLVQMLVAQGKDVLIASYTHSAVDNILLKLNKSGVPFLRLGPPSKIHSALQKSTPTHLCKDIATMKELEDFYHSQQVVATTCLGIAHPIFSRRMFDVCIIDEASQITLPTCVGPLRHAHIFVLVGDHYQLSPLVLSQQARDGGLDVSLFRYLSERHPSALISLEKQYRMNREIMNLANKMIYNDRLQCGNEEVAMGTLKLIPMEHDRVPQWMAMALDPHLPVLFLDTDQCSDAREVNTGGQVGNMFEAKLAASLILNLLKHGLAGEEIGVITPLRHQQILIQELICSITQCESHNSLRDPVILSQDLSSIEVNTVDKYQGRDKECIIISFVRSNSKGSNGMLLHDWRRINVALTRAKHKLLMVGSSSTLYHVPILRYMLNILTKEKQIVTISDCSFIRDII